MAGRTTVRVTAYECKTKQAEVFRRAAAGETIIVTNNGVPQVEIRKAPADAESMADALGALRAFAGQATGSGRYGQPPRIASDAG